MPKYRWTIIFEAEDDDDADAQTDEALDAFHSYISEWLDDVKVEGSVDD